MKIIHVIFSLLIGGAETMLVDIVNSQVSKGHDVSLLIINDGVDNQLLSTIDDRVNVVHWLRHPGRNVLLLFVKLNAWLYIKKPDVVHLHDYKLSGLIRGMDNKLIYTVHDLRLSQKYLRATIKQVAITDAVKNDVLSISPNANISVIYNGIKIHLIRKRDQRLFDENCFKIVQSARLDSNKKGQDILIKAVGILDKRGYKNITVDFIGDGPDREMLGKLAIDNDIESRVNFRGFMSRSDVYNAYADYDLMVHPSRYEGFGLIIAEAMAAGLPVAVPSSGGPFEVVDRGHYGELFDMDSPKSCADAIERIINNYPKMLLRADEARKYATESYSLDVMVDKYLSVYSNKFFE